MKKIFAVSSFYLSWFNSNTLLQIIKADDKEQAVFFAEGRIRKEKQVENLESLVLEISPKYIEDYYEELHPLVALVKAPDNANVVGNSRPDDYVGQAD